MLCWGLALLSLTPRGGRLAQALAAADATTAPLGDGSMESNSVHRVEIPENFEDAPIDHIVNLIADMLERLISHNDRIPLSPESLTRFHSRTAPSITVLDYLKRIVRFTNVEKSVLLITLFNIDQVCARVPLFTLSSLTCHRFVITSIAVSSKGLCDAFCPNNLYARVGGISVTELNVLERTFLSMIEWRLMCTREILQEYYVNLVRTHSTGMFYLAGGESPSHSSDSDIDLDSGGSSPTETPAQPSAVLREPSGMHEFTQRPTIEQNMAFAALQQLQAQQEQADGAPMAHRP